ncbi:hypothetical protein DV735_g1601, partial [Chaetothyriales sp. CBS 134920]
MEQLIHELYSPANQGSKDRIQDIQRQIQQLQRQPSAWQLALDFLQNGDANVRFYGALTLIVKINADWDADGVAGNDSMKASLHQALISAYVRLALSGDASFVIQKLCSAIAMLYQRLAPTWQSPVLQVLVSLLEEKHVEPTQLPSFTDALESAHSRSIKHLSAAVRFASTIAEDLIDRSTGTNTEILGFLSHSCEDAFRLFDLALESTHNKLSASDDDRQHVDLAQMAIQGILPWQMLLNTFTSTSSSPEIQPTLDIVANATRKVFQLYQTEALRSYVLQAMIWVQQTTPRFMTTVDPSFPQSFIRSSAAQQTVQKLMEGSFDHEETLFVDLLDTIMSQVNYTSPAYLQDPALTDVLQVLQALLRCPGVAAIEDTVCQVILEIVNQLVSGRAEWDTDTEDRNTSNFLVTFTREACEACFAKSLMPVEEMSSTTQTWDADDRSRFSSFRFDVQDFLLAAFPVLGPALLEAITSNLQNPQSQPNWPVYEASVFCLRAFADAMSEDSAAFAPYIEAVLSSQYFHVILTSRDVPDQARKTSISFLSDITAYIKQHPQLMQILDFLFASLHMPAAATSASQAIHSLCYDQRASLTSALPGFMASLSTVDDIDATDRQRIFAAVSAIVQALQREEDKVEPLLQITHMLTSVFNSINNTEMSVEDLKVQLADMLRSLAAVGRGLRIPNDVPSELDHVVHSDIAFWTTGQGLSVQQQVIGLYEKVMGRASGIQDPGITEAASDFLRSGLTEDHPSPFKFPVAVSTNLVTALITADSANIDATPFRADLLPPSSAP